MSELIFIVGVSNEAGRLTFHRARAAIELLPDGRVVLTGTPVEPTYVYLDPSLEPIYSYHPEGGWVSPTFARLTELKESGIEPDEVYHIKCRCHKLEHSKEDISSLERCGHALSCPKRPQQPAPASFPPGPSPAAQTIINISRDNQQSETRAVPPGGVSWDLVSGGLWAALQGTSDDMGSVLANFKQPHADPGVVAQQLRSETGMTRCVRCNYWKFRGEMCTGCQETT